MIQKSHYQDQVKNKKKKFNLICTIKLRITIVIELLKVFITRV